MCVCSVCVCVCVSNQCLVVGLLVDIYAAGVCVCVYLLWGSSWRAGLVGVRVVGAHWTCGARTTRTRTDRTQRTLIRNRTTRDHIRTQGTTSEFFTDT